jgi:hypothetical protein
VLKPAERSGIGATRLSRLLSRTRIAATSRSTAASRMTFVELALDAVEPSVNAAQVKQPDIFRFVVLWGIFVVSHDRAYTRWWW